MMTWYVAHVHCHGTTRRTDKDVQRGSNRSRCLWIPSHLSNLITLACSCLLPPTQKAMSEPLRTLGKTTPKQHQGINTLANLIGITAENEYIRAVAMATTKPVDTHFLLARNTGQTSAPRWVRSIDLRSQGRREMIYITTGTLNVVHVTTLFVKLQSAQNHHNF